MTRISRLPRAALTALLVGIAVSSCRDPKSDAYGNFEATEVTVASEVGGRLLALALEEGDRVAKGAVVGTVDTIPLVLERRAVAARRAAGASRAREASSTIAGLEVQQAIAERELSRTQRLIRNAAATAQQADRAERDVKVIKEQLNGAHAARSTLAQELAALDAQVAQIDDRLARSRIITPLSGTVLARYVEAGEFVQPGQPLFKLASLDSLIFRAYVSGEQLSTLKLGQMVRIGVDRADSIALVPGRVTWIASAAEFTPTPIQTREERADQVYAVKVTVGNAGGVLKIGMPGELMIGQSSKNE